MILRVWLPISLDLGSDGDSQLCYTDQSWHPHLLRTTEKKRRSLGPSLRFEKEVTDRQGQAIRIITSKRLPLQERSIWLSYLIHRNQHRKSSKMGKRKKKKRNMFQTKEECKALEKHLSETETKILSDEEL